MDDARCLPDAVALFRTMSVARGRSKQFGAAHRAKHGGAGRG